MVHTSVCREQEAPRVATERPRQRGEIFVGVPVWFFPEQLYGLSAQVHLTNCVSAVLIGDRLARGGFRANRDLQNEKSQNGYDKFGKVFRHGPAADPSRRQAKARFTPESRHPESKSRIRLGPIADIDFTPDADRRYHFQRSF